MLGTVDIRVKLDSPAAPLGLEISIGHNEFYYRERHYRWQVYDDKDTILDSGTASMGDGIIAGVTRTLNAVKFESLFYDYDPTDT